VRIFVLDAETMPYMDTTGAASLEQVCADFKARGMVVAIAAAKGPVRDMLDRTGLAEQMGANRLFASVNDAVEAFTNTGD
jgi:SulP family sulfate permease